MEFRLWLTKKNTNKKVASDIVSRLKRFERELNHCDIDDEYYHDKCQRLLLYFENKGVNSNMVAMKSTLPIGKYQLSTYKYALRKYIAFLEETTSGNL